MLDQQTPETLIALLAETLAELRKPKLSEKELWTVSDIALFLDLAKYSVQAHIIKQPTFPLPTEIPSRIDRESRTKRWYAEEVRQWAARFRANQVLKQARIR